MTNTGVFKKFLKINTFKRKAALTQVDFCNSCNHLRKKGAKCKLLHHIQHINKGKGDF